MRLPVCVQERGPWVQLGCTYCVFIFLRTLELSLYLLESPVHPVHTKLSFLHG